MKALGVSPVSIEQRMSDFVTFGKPTVDQYTLVQERLQQQHGVRRGSISHVYMVGDNPASDIQGAINMEKHNTNLKEESPVHWSGVLVETGVYKHE
jgi:ribonucleotide monophosphatase NagD (HAD superfamily)